MVLQGKVAPCGDAAVDMFALSTYKPTFMPDQFSIVVLHMEIGTSSSQQVMEASRYWWHCECGCHSGVITDVC